MTRPTNKAELLAAATAEFDRLFEAIDLVAVEQRAQPGACGEWSVKDLLAHLHAWQDMTLGWARAGARGQVPSIPAPGYTWADVPALNHAIFERTRADAWSDVVSRLRRSHQRVLTLIESTADGDLFTKRRVAWTGTTSVGSYLVSATSSHYAWASKLIRRWAKEHADPTDPTDPPSTRASRE